MNHAKALACTLPYLTDLEELVLKNNGLEDDGKQRRVIKRVNLGAALILRSVYQIERFKSLTISKNEICYNFTETFEEYSPKFPK